MATARILALVLPLTLAGAGATAETLSGGKALPDTALRSTPGAGHARGAGLAPDASYLPLRVGRGLRYRPPLRSTAATRTARGLGCSPLVGQRRGLHLELFAGRHVVLVPAGLGILGTERAGPYVRGGRCFFPLLTREPTGVVELGMGQLRLGDLFALWGQPLSPWRLAGFGRGPVRAYLDGRLIVGDPARIVLRPHGEIVLEVGGYVPPHKSYVFPKGL